METALTICWASSVVIALWAHTVPCILQGISSGQSKSKPTRNPPRVYVTCILPSLAYLPTPS